MAHSQPTTGSDEHRKIMKELATSLDAIDGGTSGGQRPYDSTVETVTSGAISVAARTTRLSVTGTVAYTLAAPATKGQRKAIHCTVAASTPAGTITVTNLIGGTTLAFNAVDDAVILEECDGKWLITANNSVTVS